MKALRLYFLAAAIAILSGKVHAKIWTVDNNPGNSAADFTSLATAVGDASVLAGDTIYVAGSSLDYSATVTVTKKLYIFGPGFFLAENLDLQANTAPASLSSSITFDNGSEGSIIQGMTFENYVYFFTSNITFRRNRTYSFFSFQSSVSNIIFVQNFCTNATSSTVMGIGSSNTNILISNNFFENTSTGSMINTPNPSNVIIANNIFSTTGTAVLLNAGTSGSFDNNIIRSGAFTNSSLIVPRNNIGNATQFGGTANGNFESIDMATIFLNTGTSDAKWQILASSLADGTGLSGEDRGMYGGNSPYVISGLPPIPSIYFMSVPVSGSAAQGLPVTIKAKSHN